MNPIGPCAEAGEDGDGVIDIPLEVGVPLGAQVQQQVPEVLKQLLRRH